MIDRLWSVAWTLSIFVCLAVAGAQAQTAQSSTSPSPDAAAQAGSPPAAQPAKPPAPALNTAEIVARANKSVGVDIQKRIAGWQHELARLESELQKPHLRYSDLNDFRDDLQRVRGEIAEFRDHLDPALAAAKDQLGLLGAAPAAGQPPEPDDVAQTRAERTYYLGVLTGGEKEIDSANLRIENLIDTIQDIRRKNFATRLLQPVPGIYSSQTWSKVPGYVPLASQRIRDIMLGWWSTVSDQDDVLLAVSEAGLLLLVLAAVAAYGAWRLRRRRSDEDQPFWRRAAVTGAIVLLWTLPVVVPIAFIYALVADTHELPERVDWLLYSTAQSIVIVLAVSILVISAFAPRVPHWRLIPVSDRTARRICGLLLALAVVYGASTLLYMVTRVAQAPFALTVAVALPSCLLVAGIIAAILLTPLEAKHQDRTLSPRLLAVLRAPVWIAVFAIIISALAGYLALARFLAQQVVVTGSILAFAYLLLLWVDGLMQGFCDDRAATGHWLKEKFGENQRRREQLALPLGLFLKAVVIIASVPLILLQWGYTWPDVYDWYTQLFFGFRVGSTQISIAVLLASVIVFGLSYGAARLFQGWLDERVLKPAGISGGLRDSIRVGVGYVGVVIAALAAFSYAGFNLSNLAILAGAFSVGIGFGLQSVVNNFVSGLILLAERPIKVGDLVVVGGEEGYVRKISVRSTEVETFERASVMIPNSYFITEKVKNWTLRDNMRRIAIPVTVAHGSDPRAVKAILLKVANDHPSVLTLPAPSYDFEDFGVNGLTFKLFAFIDLRAGGNVAADLRIAILEAFQENGILIPSRQAEVTLQTIDLLRETAQYLSPDQHKPRTESRKPTAELLANLTRKSASLVSS
ncbi:MAG: mechanosensitive ion channel family protein [Xanthobacteraceae bacterium]|nr:mechanosensitive ion channel family protein [Xanthobacteraceae bacterium]